MGSITTNTSHLRSTNINPPPVRSSYNKDTPVNVHETPSKILFDYVVPDLPAAQDSSVKSVHPQGDQVFLDHRGPVRLQLQPDGSFICEPGSSPREPAVPPAAPPSPPQPASTRSGLSAAVLGQKYLELATVISLSSGSLAGFVVLLQAATRTATYTPLQLFMTMSETISCATAGAFTGIVLGPTIAAAALAKSLAAPLAAVTSLWGLHRVVLNMGSARRLVRQINSSDVLRQLEAVRKVAVRAARSDRFRELFHKHGGVEAILRLLSSSPQGEAASLIANALAHLVQHPACKDAVVSCSGVGLVAQLLEHPDPMTIAHAVQALAHLSAHALAQESLKIQDVVPKLLALVRAGASITYDTPQHALQALVNLAGDAANRTSMVQHGAVPLLTSLLRDVSVLSEVKAVAVALLHQLARSNPDVAQALADIDDLAAILRRLLAALGPVWSPTKADVHALLTMLTHTPATLLGDTPVLVRPPPRLTPIALRQLGGSCEDRSRSEVLSPRSVGEEGSGLAGLDYVTLAA